MPKPLSSAAESSNDAEIIAATDDLDQKHERGILKMHECYQQEFPGEATSEDSPPDKYPQSESASRSRAEPGGGGTFDKPEDAMQVDDAQKEKEEEKKRTAFVAPVTKAHAPPPQSTDRSVPK